MKPLGNEGYKGPYYTSTAIYKILRKIQIIRKQNCGRRVKEACNTSQVPHSLRFVPRTVDTGVVAG